MPRSGSKEFRLFCAAHSTEASVGKDKYSSIKIAMRDSKAKKYVYALKNMEIFSLHSQWHILASSIPKLYSFILFVGSGYPDD